MASAYRRISTPLASLWPSRPPYELRSARGFCSLSSSMAFSAAPREALDRLDDELRRAPALGSALFSKVIAHACRRIPTLAQTGKVAHLDRLIAAGAWTDAASALVALELPAWSLRRFVHEDGEWLCSLSREPSLPLALDDTADARHHSLPLAILLALLEARRMAEIGPAVVSATPYVQPASDRIICCDNFA